MKLPGSPRTLPGRSQEPQETPGVSQALRKPQDAPGNPRRLQALGWILHSWKQVLT